LLIVEVLPIFIIIISPSRQLVITVLPVGSLILGFQISLNSLGNQLLGVLLAVLSLLVEESSLFKLFLIKLLLILSYGFTVSFTQKDWFQKRLGRCNFGFLFRCGYGLLVVT
jgi:hypothetical protein